MIGFFGNFELDYKLHFFPALRAVVNAGEDQTKTHKTKDNFLVTVGAF
jgi:iron complex outermembrane receptor protein